MQTAPVLPRKEIVESKFRFVISREMTVLFALIFLGILLTFLSPYFLTVDNIFNVLRSISATGLMSVGMTMVIITGGIDLSVGSLLAVTAMFTARLCTDYGVPGWLSIIGGLGMGALLGCINGLLVSKVKITPFIVTLGMLSIGRGITYLLATGLTGSVASDIPLHDPIALYLGGGYIGPVPLSLIQMLVVVVIFSLFLRYTVLGRQIYATGSNEQAARLSGVNVDMVRLFVYTITGILCGYAGILTAGLLSMSLTNLGQGNELDVIAACIIGGTALAGGEGTIWGAIIGAAIMAVLRNAFVLLHFPVAWQTVSIGVVIILAVAADRLRRRREGA